MINNKNEQHYRQSDGETSQSLTKKMENPTTFPGYPLKSKPTITGKPQRKLDHTWPEPDEDDPAINDPTRIDEEPPVFNNY